MSRRVAAGRGGGWGPLPTSVGSAPLILPGSSAVGRDGPDASSVASRLAGTTLTVLAVALGVPAPGGGASGDGVSSRSGTVTA